MRKKEKNVSKLKNAVVTSVDLFVENDSKLLELEAHEQAITHRVAVHLENILKEMNLDFDCEYNKHLNDLKRIDLSEINHLDWQSCGCHACTLVKNNEGRKLEEKEFRPDILVHKRNTDEQNLIAIEIKKDRICSFDKAKLKALTLQNGEYRYKLGLHLCFLENDKKFIWFIDGVEY